MPEFEPAAIKPVVKLQDFNRLDIVLVIINYRPIDIEPLLPDDTGGQ